VARRLIRKWNADPNGETVVQVYKISGLRAILRGVFLPTRSVDVPSGVSPHFYEPVPLILKANERVVVSQNGKIVMGH
jgi:hypothetical protein